jgi:hypothetical protein
VNKQIRELKGSTSSVLLPGTILRLWKSCTFLVEEKVILGTHTLFSFVSLNKAQTLAQNWMGTADADVLAHPEEFEDSVVQAAKARGTVGFPYKAAWVFALCRTMSYNCVLQGIGRAHCYELW